MENTYKLSRFMTANPATIDADCRLRQAMRMIRTNAFPHIPVLKGGRLVGLISEGDVSWASAFDNLAPFSVGDVMTRDLVTLPEDANVLDAIKQMQANQAGAVIVVDDSGHVPVGILTTTDALRALLAFVDLLLIKAAGPVDGLVSKTFRAAAPISRRVLSGSRLPHSH